MRSRETPKKSTARSSAAATHIHALWLGTRLSNLEMLTVHSFLSFGHPFTLWAYDDIETPLPEGLAVRDASKILPRDRIFLKAKDDPAIGLGAGSYAPFSDLFRYKLLYEKGGVWVDMDVCCLRPFAFSEDYVFRPHQIGIIGNMMKVPARSELMQKTFEEVDRLADSNIGWLTANHILNRNVVSLGLEKWTKRGISNDDKWTDVAPYVEGYRPPPDDWYFIHWMNEAWNRRADAPSKGGAGRAPDKDRVPRGSTIHELYRYFGVVGAEDEGAQPRLDSVMLPKIKDVRTDVTVRFSRDTVLPPQHILIDMRGRSEFSFRLDDILSYDVRSPLPQVLFILGPRVEVRGSDHTRCEFVGLELTDAIVRRIALDARAAGAPALMTLGIPPDAVQRLEAAGVVVVPLVFDAELDLPPEAEAYNILSVPLVIAGGESVGRRLRDVGLRKPVTAVRSLGHQVSAPEGLAKSRNRIRRENRVGEDTILIGMFGAFLPRRAYTKAVRVLAAARRHRDARLMIVGPVEASEESQRAYLAAMELAAREGLLADIIVISGLAAFPDYLAAFDVLLSTSLWEPVNLPLIQSIYSGCPAVVSDVDGNADCAPPSAVLMAADAEADDFASAILAAVVERDRLVSRQVAEADFVARLRSAILSHGLGSSVVHHAPPGGTMFVSAHLHIGGPARSLGHLLRSLPIAANNCVCVLGGISEVDVASAMEDRQIPLLRLQGSRSLQDRVEMLLQWVDLTNVGTVCFWNVPAELKLLLTKCLANRALRFVDVSPGPMWFDELDDVRDLQRQIAFSSKDYIERLDSFVYLYGGGSTEEATGYSARSAKLIPLGVPRPSRFVPLPPEHALLPEEFESGLAIGTCCRIVPDKRLEFLLEMMRTLETLVPGVSLTIVGGPDSTSVPYWNELVSSVQREGRRNIRFVGPHQNVLPFLKTFKVFVMVSDRQGCPNASLEAMSMGLPVVANPSGGTGEQVKDGITGFLVEDSDRMAERVALLLGDYPLRRKMGAAARSLARTTFSIENMVSAFRDVLQQDGSEGMR